MRIYLGIASSRSHPHAPPLERVRLNAGRFLPNMGYSLKKS
jgi:hypothetical protein